MISWARSLQIPRSPKAVLLALSSRANKQHQCWPSIKLLAADASLSHDTVQRALEWLRSAGLIERQLRYDKRGKRTANLYAIKVGNSPQFEGVTNTQPACKKTIRLARNRAVTNTQSAGDHIIELPNELPKKESFTNVNALRAASAHCPDSAPAPSKKWCRQQEEKRSRKPLTEVVAAAIDPEAADEQNFWAVVNVMAKAGIRRSLLVQVGKLHADFGDALDALRSTASKKDPTTYLAGIKRHMQAEVAGGYRNEPEFIREFRDEGGWKIRLRPDGTWEVGPYTYSPTGEQIGF